MKTLITIAALAVALSVHAGDETGFEIVKQPKIGESNAFEITKSRRAILKAGDESYIILDLLDSSREDGDKTFTEACRISWTLITPSGIRNGIESTFIRYRSEKTGDDSFSVNKIGGSDEINLGSVSLRWSYGSQKSVFIYSEPGTQYATTNVEQGGAGQPATRPESK